MIVYKKRAKGFTLIELILTVAIILILTLVVVPSVMGYRHYANKKAIDGTSKIILNAVELYNSESAMKFSDDEITSDMTISDVKGYLSPLLREEDIKEIDKYIDSDVTIKVLKEFSNDNNEEFYCENHERLENNFSCNKK